MLLFIYCQSSRENDTVLPVEPDKVSHLQPKACISKGKYTSQHFFDL